MHHKEDMHALADQSVDVGAVLYGFIREIERDRERYCKKPVECEQGKKHKT